MDLLRTFLRTAFSLYPIEEQSGKRRFLLKEPVFVDTAKKFTYDLSDDQIKLLFKLYQDVWSKGIAEPNIFYTLIPFVKETIIEGVKSPYVRLEHVFKWRELTQHIGEDLPVCASLALQDVYKERHRNFDWPFVLQTDDVNLQYLFKQGLPELHHHLKASTDVFSISWLCMMNHIRGRAAEMSLMSNLQEERIRLYDNYIEAVAIRLELSRYLLYNDYVVTESIIKNNVWQAKIGNLAPLENEINRLSMYDRHRYDYLFRHIKKDSDNCVYSSERWLIYSVLKRIYEGDDNELVVSLMWRYIVIKNQLRNKLIQINENIGFANFSEFEKRKQIFINKYPTYKNLLVELPIEEAYRHHYVNYIETRITPENTCAYIKDKLADMQKLINRRLTVAEIDKIEYRFIFHFIKIKDDREYDYTMPRNYNARGIVRRQAKAIKAMLLHYPHHGEVVVGIDAANSEFFCRPEVFAQAYRYLTNTGLKFTYHVGEDFYDITDGLRAIDEAIHFLHVRRGDRLGHCLALAYDVKLYYGSKHYTIPIPRQTLLDNLVWLLFKAKSYNIQVPPSIEMLVSQKFAELSEPYCCQGLRFNITDYYHSMMLRGDNPLGRKDMSYGNILDYWEAYDIDNDAATSSFRHTEAAQEIFRLYHFGERVRRDGMSICEFKVDDVYIDLLYEVQERMMDDIERRGIAIECCPSSNLKIGRLLRYDNHPIFRMSDVSPDGKHHLAVTINTDDLGIFTTSLDNEYSLILSALMKMKDDLGKPKYNSLFIQNWLERIVLNGCKYAFGN